ncbi:MAG: YgiQ family radical SAM protein [Desulfobulbaceae bacterium A2]|nr:MAG: YgiQ family radical SAM protein [Desulfobulbaceae bacterium A2]
MSPPRRGDFLPMTREAMADRGWDELDVLLVTGDAYVDHPAFGAAMIGRVLEAAGCRVGIIAQPDWRDVSSIQRLGRPRLFCGVTAGNLDSMLANYSAARHKRREDEYSEDGRPGRRPNHAAVVYAQMCRQAFPGVPVVLGGLEASMRRVAHYDYWEDKLRPSILADAKADILVYGMGETAVREITRRLRAGEVELGGIPGTARFLGSKATAALDNADMLQLPAWEELRQDSSLLLRLTRLVEAEQNPWCGRRLLQRHGDRAVLVEPPAYPLPGAEMDAVYALPFQRAPHPDYRGPIPGFATVRDSIVVMRGCAGGCTFCGLGLHQGKFLASRSVESIVAEIKRLVMNDDFHGTISDLGGPTANLYACRNGHSETCRACRRSSCLWPKPCVNFILDEAALVALLRRARTLPGVKHLFIQSGIRMDVALRTPEYLRELVRHHVSGHLKVAPEHLHPEVLKRMHKPAGDFLPFLERFRQWSREVGKEQYVVPYFISSFPGCTDREMAAVGNFLAREHWKLQQVQDFIPLPMTSATAMYVTGLDITTGRPIPVVRNAGERERQKAVLRPPVSKAGPPASHTKTACPSADNETTFRKHNRGAKGKGTSGTENGAAGRQRQPAVKKRTGSR